MPYFIYLLSIVACPLISPPLCNEVQRELPLLLKLHKKNDGYNSKNVDPSEFLRIGNKFVNLQRYKDCFFTKKIKNLIFLKIILIKHLDKSMFLKNKVKMLI